jgi:hypothetical protein
MKQKFAVALTSLWLIFFAALAIRMTYAWDQQRKIPGDALLLRFHQETGNIAASLAAGKGFSSPFGRDTGPTAWVAPVYPLIVAGIFRLFGLETLPSFHAATFLNMLFSALACIPIFYAAKRVSTLGAASAAAWFWAVLPNAVIFPFEWIWDTSLSALLAATLLWATLAVADSSRLRNWCGYGLFWGFALLTNPALGAALPFLLGWAAFRAVKRGVVRLQVPALAACVAVLCCAPWTIRNYRVFRRFIPLRSNLGVEMYVGNNENYGPHPPVWPFSITREREIYRFFRIGEAAFMQEEMQKALRFMAANPGVEVRLTGERIVSFWLGTPSPFADFLSADLFLRFVAVCSFLLTAGTIAGLALLFLARNEFAFPVAAFPLFFPLIYYLAHASLRFRHAIDPILVLVSAVAAAALVRTVFAVRLPERAQTETLRPG